MKITVVGAVNIDLLACPSERFVAHESNPGKVKISLGGVGRNIAHNLCLMGRNVELLTVFGGDHFAPAARSACEMAGITLSGDCRTIDGARSNYYICVNDSNGEMLGGVADMELMDHMTPDMLARSMDNINSSVAVVTDCNLPAESLVYLVEHCMPPLYIDATSAAKAMRLRPLLLEGKAKANVTLKVNVAEAKALSAEDGDVSSMAQWFLDHGVGRILITMGSDGAYYHDGKTGIHKDACPVDVVNVTGGGDAFFAAVVAAETIGRTPHQALDAGLQAAALALKTMAAVNPEVKKLKVGSINCSSQIGSGC